MWPRRFVCLPGARVREILRWLFRFLNRHAHPQLRPLQWPITGLYDALLLPSLKPHTLLATRGAVLLTVYRAPV